MRRLVPIGQRANALIRVNGDALKNTSLRAPIDVIEIRDRLDVGSRIGFLPSIELTERGEILRFMEWKRPRQHGIEHAEHGRVRTNSERKRQNDDGGKERLLTKDAKGISEILHRLFRAKSDDWIDAGSAARRNPRSKEGCSKK